MTDDTYNGWTNRETWCVSLWLDSDMGLNERADDIRGAATKAWHAAEGLRDFVTEHLTEEAEGFALDMMQTALARVNWGEIAGHRITDASA